MIAGVVAGQGGLKIMANGWQYIGGSTYDEYQNIGIAASPSNTVCPTVANILDYINANFSAVTYEKNYVIGFETFNVPVMFPQSCGIKCFKAVVKKWVFLDYFQSEPDYNVYRYNSSANTTNATSILETAYPAGNTAAGTIGVVYNGSYYYECEVQYA